MEGLSRGRFRAYFEPPHQTHPTHENLFFDAQFESSAETGKQLNGSDALGMTASPGHLLGQIWIRPDFMRVSVLNSEWVQKNWPEEFLETSSADKYSDVFTLLNSTASLRDELARHANSEDFFRTSSYLCREGTDCGRTAIEDQLARTPDDRDAVDDAIAFYVVRGNFTKAIALRRHEIGIKTTANETRATFDQLYLAELLLCNREYESGRSLLREIHEPSSSGRYPQIEDYVRSYFLEGNYDKTIEAAGEIQQDDQKSAHDIALAYFALYRLGRGKEAEEYLQKESSAFKGPADEQLLLLRLARRLTSEPSEKGLELSSYYSALLAIRDGKTENARWFLQQQISHARKDILETIGAQIELERLGPSSAK